MEDFASTDDPGSSDDQPSPRPDRPTSRAEQIEDDLHEIELALDRIATACDRLEYAETLSASGDADISAAGHEVGEVLAQLDDVRNTLLRRQQELERALQDAESSESGGDLGGRAGGPGRSDGFRP
jgi:chromosome segregation ATPase